MLIVETRQGFVCANAGVDRSNVDGDGLTVCLLPVDCDASAQALRDRVTELAGAQVGVIVSDTFGRAWRMGLVNVALGVAGIPAVLDYRGRPDDFGMPLQATVVAIADELAAAAELLMGKTRRVPAVVVRGLDVFEGPPGPGRSSCGRRSWISSDEGRAPLRRDRGRAARRRLDRGAPGRRSLDGRQHR